MTDEIRYILEQGRKYELEHHNGACIHKFPRFETTIMLNFYDYRKELGLIGELEEWVMQDLAKCWEKYFEIGHEEYWRQYRLAHLNKRTPCKTVFKINKNQKDI